MIRVAEVQSNYQVASRARTGHYGHVTTHRLIRRKRETAQRSIHFFRLEGGADESGVPKLVDLQPALKFLDELPFSSVNGRYVVRGDVRQCAWVEEIGPTCKLRFASIRSNALPQLEAGGQLRDLEVAEDDGLCETSHMCIFPDGIVGVEFNFYGPRASRFADYLRTLVREECPEFALEALLRQDIAAELQRKKAVRKISFSVRRSYVSTVEEADASLGAAMRAAEEGSNADCVGVYLEPEPYQRRNLNEQMLDFIRRMAGRPDLRDNAREFKVTVIDEETEKADELDLLRDHLISQTRIFKQHARTRVLDSKDAYKKIDRAFAERRDDLLAAASVGRRP